MKLKKLLKLLTKPVKGHRSGKPFFGKVVARVHVIEFQKRGLPHAHILLILDGPDKPRTPDDYDRHVRAELPDEKEEPELFKAVVENMLHGPCGKNYRNAPCMVDGKCSKGFPKPFQEARVCV
mgnify:CR=1 FL=1